MLIKYRIIRMNHLSSYDLFITLDMIRDDIYDFLIPLCGLFRERTARQRRLEPERHQLRPRLTKKKSRPLRTSTGRMMTSMWLKNSSER